MKSKERKQVVEVRVEEVEELDGKLHVEPQITRKRKLG